MTFHARTDIGPMTDRRVLYEYVCDLEARLYAKSSADEDQVQFNLSRAFGLTTLEAKLLSLLADGRGHSKIGLLEMMYDGADDAPEVKIIDVFICKIRRKVAGSAIDIRTIWGTGYIVEDTAPLKHVMAGEPPVPGSTHAACIGKPFGAEAKPHGSLTAAAWAVLSKHANPDGVVLITARDLSSEAQLATVSGSSIIRNLEKTGRLRVLAKSESRGSPWRLKLLEAA